MSFRDVEDLLAQRGITVSYETIRQWCHPWGDRISCKGRNRHVTIAPWDTYDAADGVLALAVGNDPQWQRLCTALKAVDLAADRRFDTNAARVLEHDLGMSAADINRLVAEGVVRAR